MTTTTATTITAHDFFRSQYGELLTIPTKCSQAARDLLDSARALVRMAASKSKIPAAYDGMSWEKISSRIGYKKTGDALHHEIYDISPDGKHVLVCCRSVEGTKHGIKTTHKEYYIVHKYGAGTRVEQANKATAAKLAKASGDGLGLAIDILIGKAKPTLLKATIRYGFKLVKRNEAGELVSVWDDSPWTLGVERGERATSNHTGGFYYYRTAEEALEAAKNSDVFGPLFNHSGLVLLAVESRGSEYRFNSGKLCCTYLKPTSIEQELV